jgi:hypothetical protein
MRFRTILSGALLVLLFFGNSHAQQTQQRLNESGWLLEVTYLKGAPPAYERVRLPGSKKPGDWFARFGRVAGWQLPADAQPIQAVRISNRLRQKDEIVRIRVSVIRGRQFMDVEETVATFDLRENEKVTVAELRSFGIEPFELRPLKTAPLSGNLPAVINKTESVEVLSIEPVVSDLPEYKLTLHNRSTKAIDALYVDILNGERQISSGMPQGLEGRSLIPAGEVAQVRLPLIVRAGATKGAYAPAVGSDQKFVIRSAVFADASTEGITEQEIQSGPGFHSVRFGEQLEMRRALPLFVAALQSTDAISADGISRLREHISAIDVEITDADLVNLQRRFPAQDAKVLREWVEFGVHFLRKEMLDQLARFETNAKDKDFRTWLINNNERYSNWLARLEPTAASLP